MERGYIIFYRIGIHCEIQAVPFLRPFSCKRAELKRAQLSKMAARLAVGRLSNRYLPYGARQLKNSF